MTTESDSCVVPRENDNLFFYEVVRRASFVRWPKEHIVSGDALAADGFKYSGDGDKVNRNEKNYLNNFKIRYSHQVTCIFCNGTLRNWIQGDIVRVEHRRHFNTCPFINGNEGGNIRDLKEKRSTAKQLRNRNVSHPKFSDIDRRMATFADKEEYTQYAEAGFWRDEERYITFCCGIRLDSKPSFPFEIHAEMKPTCVYLRDVKGVDFVGKVSRSLTNKIRGENLCKNCFSKEISHTLIPCAHYSICDECRSNVTHCPVCNSQINGAFKTIII